MRDKVVEISYRDVYKRQRIRFPIIYYQLQQVLQLPIPPVEVNSDRVSVPVDFKEQAAHVKTLVATPNRKLYVVLAVSYTHLDVYKRQPPDSLRG